MPTIVGVVVALCVECVQAPRDAGAGPVEQGAVVALDHPPGTSRVGGVLVHERKPFFHGAVALGLARIKSPFVFAIDANEPLSETVGSITFHWANDRSGVKKLQALLGLEPIHRGRDLFREWLAGNDGDPASADVLLATYAPTPVFQRRFDSMWATPEFGLVQFATLLDEVVSVGGDHGMLVADLCLG